MMERQQPTQGAHILLVKDDPVLRDLLQRNLVARRHRVSGVEDTRDALALLQETVFDLIILDINLPDQTGWELLRIARRKGWLHTREYAEGRTCLPVVVVSAVHASLTRLKEFPLLAYLPKPFPIEALLRLVEESARRGGKSTQSV